MYEMRIAARIIDLFGGLDALAQSDLTFDISPREIVYIEHCGTGPHGAPFELISVGRFLDPDGIGGYEPAPEFWFEVDPSDDRKRGWRSGSWLPVGYANGIVGDRSFAYRESDDGSTIWGAYFESVWLPENRAWSRRWDRQLATDGIVDLAEREVARRRAEQELDRAKAAQKRRRPSRRVA